MEVEVEIVTFKERLSRTRSRQFDILLTGWGADYQDPMTFLDLLMSRSGNNSAHYNSSQYDELVTKAMKSNKKDERINYLFEAERLLAKKYLLYLYIKKLKFILLMKSKRYRI